MAGTPKIFIFAARCCLPGNERAGRAIRYSAWQTQTPTVFSRNRRQMSRWRSLTCHAAINQLYNGVECDDGYIEVNYGHPMPWQSIRNLPLCLRAFWRCVSSGIADKAGRIKGVVQLRFMRNASGTADMSFYGSTLGKPGGVWTASQMPSFSFGSTAAAMASTIIRINCS